MKVAINGFGRIGRSVVRALYELDIGQGIEIVTINTPGSIQNAAHLLKYDSVHGAFKSKVELGDDCIYIDKRKIIFTHERNIGRLDWTKYNIDVVIECTGIFNDNCSQHISSGAKKVLISAPSSNCDFTVVYGVNHLNLDSDHKIISVGSCTTNCLAPVLYILNKEFGVKNGFMTTIHSYTNDQNIVDNNHKKDLYRARACALSMIPTCTGAAKTIGKIIPELDNKIDGVAIRVPTPNVSLVDLAVNLKKDTLVNEINDAFKNAENIHMNGVLATSNECLVSIDFNHNSKSCIVDLNGTHLIDGRFARIAAWYDNEWGFAARIADILNLISLQ